jgi:imidazole glycerol-phosphate synthase subunit HisH
MINILILDYSVGNLHSVKRKIQKLGVTPVVSSCASDIKRADKIIMPGVGHFKNAMDCLNDLHLADALQEAVLISKKPILGICLGMQLMAKKSEEGNVEGLGWLDAEVVKFDVSDSLKYKVPHTGWNQIQITKQSLLMKNILPSSEFYFNHSYHFKASVSGDILNQTTYEYDFTTAVERDNIFGVQYHPEKSHDSGIQLLKNFVDL